MTDTRSSSESRELQQVYEALSQAQDCLRNETPEDMTPAEAIEDTSKIIREAMHLVEIMQTRTPAITGHGEAEVLTEIIKLAKGFGHLKPCNDIRRIARNRLTTIAVAFPTQIAGGELASRLLNDSAQYFETLYQRHRIAITERGIDPQKLRIAAAALSPQAQAGGAT